MRATFSALVSQKVEQMSENKVDILSATGDPIQAITDKIPRSDNISFHEVSS